MNDSSKGKLWIIILVYGKQYCHCIPARAVLQTICQGLLFISQDWFKCIYWKTWPGLLGVQPYTSAGLQVFHTGETKGQSRHLLVQSCMLLLVWNLSKTFQIPAPKCGSGLTILRIAICILITTKVMGSNVYLYYSYHLIPLNLQCGLANISWQVGHVEPRKEFCSQHCSESTICHSWAILLPIYPAVSVSILELVSPECLLKQKRSHHNLQHSALLHVWPEGCRLHSCPYLSGGEQPWWSTGIDGKGGGCQVSWMSSPAGEAICSLQQEHGLK